MNVFGFQADHAGTSTYRVRWPLAALSRYHGVDVRHDTLLKKGDRDWADCVLAQRVCLPGPSAIWKQWHDEGKKTLVMDFDDDLFSVPESNLQASALYNSRNIRQRLLENVTLSDWVTVTTPVLKGSIHERTGFPLERIIVVPNAVPEELLVDVVPEPGGRRHSVGYLASTTHTDDFKMIRRHLGRFLENNEGVSFVSVGADYTHLLPSRERASHRRWDSRPERAIESIDYEMSLAPLIPGVFNSNRSHCKWVEASARGVVSLVSDTVPYAPVEHGVTGVKVNREHEWGRALQRLWDDPERRYRLAVAAHEEVARKYTTRVTSELWHDVLTRGKSH